MFFARGLDRWNRDEIAGEISLWERTFSSPLPLAGVESSEARS
jgi:hypothetical protein